MHFFFQQQSWLSAGPGDEILAVNDATTVSLPQHILFHSIVQCALSIPFPSFGPKVENKLLNFYLELAVLALARIMCANIHSQNGTAILAQELLSRK